MQEDGLEEGRLEGGGGGGNGKWGVVGREN